MHLFKLGLLHLTPPLYAVAVPLNALAIFATGAVRKTHDPYLVVEDKVIVGAVLLATVWLAWMQVQGIFSRAASADGVRQHLSRDLAAWPAGSGDTVVVWDYNFPYDLGAPVSPHADGAPGAFSTPITPAQRHWRTRYTRNGVHPISPRRCAIFPVHPSSMPALAMPSRMPAC